MTQKKKGMLVEKKGKYIQKYVVKYFKAHNTTYKEKKLLLVKSVIFISTIKTKKIIHNDFKKR
jgi:hypothetical protein